MFVVTLQALKGTVVPHAYGLHLLSLPLHLLHTLSLDPWLHQYEHLHQGAVLAHLIEQAAVRYRLGMGVVLMGKELQRTLGLSHSSGLQSVGHRSPVRRLCLLHSVLVDH
jgi:hypothetical protein